MVGAEGAREKERGGESREWTGAGSAGSCGPLGGLRLVPQRR